MPGSGKWYSGKWVAKYRHPLHHHKRVNLVGYILAWLTQVMPVDGLSWHSVAGTQGLAMGAHPFVILQICIGLPDDRLLR